VSGVLCHRKDIHNVKVQYNVGCTQKHANDHTSVQTWVEELNAMNEDSPVLLYKAQGDIPSATTQNLSACDFILCLQTITQRRFMLQFGAGNIVCLDSTHGTTQYDFYLVTVMVVDDFGEGNPVAFMISNREDEAALTAFFQAIKSRLPDDDYHASHVMTDDANQYYNAWVSVFGTAEKKLCTWHIDRTWRRALKQHVPQSDEQIEIYHMLRCLLQELNEVDFKHCLSSFMQHINQVAPNFAAYFSHYCQRTTEWAFCYRIGTQANTNMYVESFHNVLKTCYLERKANRRVDNLISMLLRIARDKAFERLVKVEKNSHSKKLQEINRRHNIVVNDLPAMTGAGWHIPSQSGEHHYSVVPAKEVCSCNLHCRTCNCCPHMYECSCVDFAVHATVCKHVHTVHQLRSASAEVANMEPVPTTGTVAVIDNAAHDEDEDMVPENLVSVHEPQTTRLRVITKCQQLMTVAGMCDNTEALQCALKHLQAAEASLHAIAKHTPSTFNTERRLPANKKLEKQVRFHSTKMKRRSKQQTLQKPTTSAVNAVKNFLMHDSNDNAFSSLSADSVCVEVPYCVDTEDVLTEEMSG